METDQRKDGDSMLTDHPPPNETEPARHPLSPVEVEWYAAYDDARRMGRGCVDASRSATVRCYSEGALL